MSILADIKNDMTGATPAKWIASILGVLAVVTILVVAGCHFIRAPAIANQKAVAAQAQAKAAVVGTQATVAAAKVAIKAIDDQNTADTATAQTQTENSNVIQALPSAETVIPAADADLWRRGLCRYPDLADDPQCRVVRSAGSAELSQARPDVPDPK